MSWLNHPSYAQALSEVSAILKGSYSSFRFLRPVVFLCGKNKSSRRVAVFQQLKRRLPGLHIFFAEDVWKRVSEDSKVNALHMEGQLAGLSDCVIIIVESPGTFTELGAFASDDILRKKLFPILDKVYEGDSSFINTGPVRWVNEEQGGNACLFTPFEPVFSVADEVEARIRSIQKTGRPSNLLRSDQLSERPKHLLFLICDILAMIGPAPISHVSRVFEAVVEDSPKLTLDTFLGLGLALKLIRSVSSYDDEEYLYRPLRGGHLEVFQRIPDSDVVRARAKVLNALTRIPAAANALDALAGDEHVA